MTGLELLKELQEKNIPANVVMASTDTVDGAQVVIDALELGALDFIHKPYNTSNLEVNVFSNKVFRNPRCSSQYRIKNY